MSRLAEEIQDAIDAWFASSMEVRQQPIGQFVAERITALQSDSELLREALLDAAVAFETDADNHTAKANLGPKSERAERTEKANRNAALGKQMRQALARLEQGDEA